MPPFSEIIDFSATLKAGASVLFIQSSLLITSALKAPKRSAFPKPSLKLVKADFPVTLSLRLNTGILGEITPAMGPTAEWLWHASKTTSPDAASFFASSGVSAQCSYNKAPITAPLCAPHICSQAIGGPA
jgi:hypothetical protein